MIRQLFHPPDHAQAVLAAIRWRLDTDQFADLDPGMFSPRQRMQ